MVEPAFRAADVSHVVPEKIGSDEIKVDAPPKQPESKWGHRIFMTVLALCGAIGAAAWQHYGDQAKAMAAEWAPPFVMAVCRPPRNRRTPSRRAPQPYRLRPPISRRLPIRLPPSR